MGDDIWTTINSKADITPEIESIIRGFADGYQESVHDALDRAEGFRLKDGTRLDFGGSLDSPGYKAALAIVRNERRNGGG